MERKRETAMDSTAKLDQPDAHNRTGTDSRSTVRYVLRAPAVYSWIDCEGVAHESLGYTRDVSPKGIFIVCADSPPETTSLTVSIQLSVLNGDRRGEVRIEAEGKVLRVEIGDASGNEGGFSVKNYRVRYERID